MSSCRSLEELHRTMSLTRTMVMLAWFSALFLDDNRRERLLGKSPNGVDLMALERRFLTALITACNGLDSFLFGIIGNGLRGGRLGIDLNPFDEQELESSKRQSLSILSLSSIVKRSLLLRLQDMGIVFRGSHGQPEESCVDQDGLIEDKETVDPLDGQNEP